MRPPPMVAIWPRGGGKCLRYDTDVLKADGTRVAIRDIKVGDRIMSYSEGSGRIEPDTIIRKIASGQKQCIRVRTRTGKEVRLTREHKVLTFDGWVTAGALTVNHRIAVPRRTRCDVTVDTKTDEEVRLVAYMLAEGSTSGNNCGFTNFDQVIVSDAMRCAETLGITLREVLPGQYGLRRNGRAWVKTIRGLGGLKSPQKFVPEWVFQLPERQKWMFLAALVDTDGWVSTERGCVCIQLASKRLVEDVMYLFMQVGVVTSMSKFRHNSGVGSWRLVCDQESISLCHEKMPLILKGDKLRQVNQRNRYSLVDTYPSSVVAGLPRGLNRRLRNSGQARLSTAYPTVTRQKIQSIQEHYAPWAFLEQSDVMWDEVSEISEDEITETYDVEVEKNHNLVTNGLVSHNSTTAELVIVLIAALLKRRYCLYICSTQERADDHVSNVGALLESKEIADYYPALASRAVGKYGNPKGWRRNRLRTANGFTLDAIGLDTAARGAKLEDVRPGIMVVDDIDQEGDSVVLTAKKISTLTKSLLPAGTSDLAVLAVQNLVIKDGIFSRLAGVSDYPADFLQDRILSGPHVAVEDPEYQERDGRIFLVGGKPTWEGQGLAVCQDMISTYGFTAFESECQHKVEPPPGGSYDHIHYEHIAEQNVPVILRIAAACDPAVSSGDDSDSNGIQIDGIGADKKVYRLFSWEARSSPEATIERVILRTLEMMARYKAPAKIIFETNQGGDLWAFAYRAVWENLRRADRIPKGQPMIRYTHVKATRDLGNKVMRGNQMLANYELGRFVHVVGSHRPLESALNRWPKTTPHDLADSAYWSSQDLISPNIIMGHVSQGAANGWFVNTA